MSKNINVSKTVTIDSAVFMVIATATKTADTSFSEELNKLCHDGMEARKAQAEHAAGGADDGGE